jgi:hypothetical protein
MREALCSPLLLGGAIPGDSWKPWRTLLIAAMGEELTDEERELYATFTGRDQEPGERVRAFWGAAGRRSGKTRAAGTFGAYVATCCDFSDCLAPGERAVLPVLAAAQHQAGKAFMHIKGVLEHSPDLSRLIDGDPTANTIRLTVPIDIEIRPANFKTIRGITAPAAIADEIGFWEIEGSKNPDKEILAALRPALLTTGGVLWVISSPYAKAGELYAAYRKHHGPSGAPRVVFAKGPSLAFNPTLDPVEIAEAYEDDAEVAAAEYGGEFRSDLADFVTREIVEACVEEGVTVRSRQAGVTYRGFVDPSGGINDSMTLGIAHQEGGRVVLDLLEERRPPFSPEMVVQEFAALLKSYGLSSATGDRYGGEWPRERFRAHGIRYELAEKTRSELYLALLPHLNSRRIALLDQPRLVSQLVGLKRRVSSGGRESVDHMRGSFDDAANAAAGAVSLFSLERYIAPAVTRTAMSTGDGTGRMVPIGGQRRLIVETVDGKTVLREPIEPPWRTSPTRWAGGLL